MKRTNLESPVGAIARTLSMIAFGVIDTVLFSPECYMHSRSRGDAVPKSLSRKGMAGPQPYISSSSLAATSPKTPFAPLLLRSGVSLLVT